jgi:hypothetical protein
MMGHILLETVTFEEHDGKTTMTSKAVYQSWKIATEWGARESGERLEELLAKVKAK